MRGYLATTDHDWFTFLRALTPPPDEVNFWQPSAHGFNAPPGTPFLFKLKAPHHAIGGFGVFARYEPEVGAVVAGKRALVVVFVVLPLLIGHGFSFLANPVGRPMVV